MKILSNDQINNLDHYTTILYNIIDEMETETPSNQAMLIHITNKIRENCRLNRIYKLHELPTTTSKPQMPEVKSPKEEKCGHAYEIAFSENRPFLFCRHCGEIKEIYLNKQNEKESVPVEEVQAIIDKMKHFEEEAMKSFQKYDSPLQQGKTIAYLLSIRWLEELISQEGK